ncbi:GNAT family N-acetyltransferase [Pseudoxanthomonas japonensis]|uniref:GNAT family N-acetyltransferase n=1 Tax=Pseudoxanthomonas japonensis TaxID=69284 RepID=UPI0037490971
MDPADEFTTKTGATVYIVVDEDQATIGAYDQNGDPIGEFEFAPQDDGQNEWHHLTSMFLEEQPQYQGQGIGEEMLRRFRDEMGTVITADENTGQKSNLGSHLTGTGVGFVARMREKKLIAPAESDHVDRPDDGEW